MFNAHDSRRGVSLLEILAGLMIAITVTMLSLQFVRQPSETSRQRSCDLQREMLQNDAQRYFDSTGNMPSRNLIELQDSRYAGSSLPTCPYSGRAYTLDRSGSIECPVHASTRSR